MKITPKELRRYADDYESNGVRGSSAAKLIAETYRAHADALEERQELIAALTGAVALIDGDLVGADWKAACREFTKDARAILARMDK